MNIALYIVPITVLIIVAFIFLKSRRPPDIFDLVWNGETDKLKVCIKNNPGLVKQRDDSGSTPLHMASHKGYEEIVGQLIAAGAEVNAENTEGFTPLFEAVKEGNRDIIKLLLGQGAVVNHTDKEGSSPLHWAAYAGNAEAVEALLSQGAETNLKNDKSSTPLHWALYKDDGKIVRLLVENGAKTTITDSKGRTPVEILQTCNTSDDKNKIISLLEGAREN